MELLLGDVVLPCHFVAGLEHGVGNFIYIFQAEGFLLFYCLNGAVVRQFKLFLYQSGGFGVALGSQVDLQVLFFLFPSLCACGELLRRGGAGSQECKGEER